MGRRTTTADWLDKTDARVDLRQSPEAEIRDRVVRRSEWLEPSDRDLVLAVYRDGQSVASLARIHACDVRALRRRVSRAIARLLDERAVFVMRHGSLWGAQRARVGREIYLNGCSLREVSRRLGVSLHAVRKHRHAIDGVFESIHRSGADRVWR